MRTESDKVYCKQYIHSSGEKVYCKWYTSARVCAPAPSPQPPRAHPRPHAISRALLRQAPAQHRMRTPARRKGNAMNTPDNVLVGWTPQTIEAVMGDLVDLLASWPRLAHEVDPRAWQQFGEHSGGASSAFLEDRSALPRKKWSRERCERG